MSQEPLAEDNKLRDELTALLDVEGLRASAVRALAASDPTALTEQLIPLLCVGDDDVHQSIAGVLRSQKLDRHSVTQTLIDGLNEPGRSRERVWILEGIEALVRAKQ